MATLSELTGGVFFLSLLSACATQSAPVDTQAAKTEAPASQSANVMNIVINTKDPIANADGEPLICKEFTKTGTRLRTIKKCHTKAGWDVISSETERTIRDMYIKRGRITDNR